MAANTPDFSKIWAQNSPLSPYSFTDSEYLRGWDFIGSTPPERTMFDAFMRNADTKMKWLYDNAFSESMLGGFMYWRQPNTAYFVGMKRRLIKAPLDVYLECITAGMSSSEELRDLPKDAKIGGTITDGAVVWQVMQMATTENSGINVLKRSHAYEVGDIAYSSLLKSYQRLECVVGGTTASTDIDVSSSTTGG